MALTGEPIDAIEDWPQRPQQTRGTGKSVSRLSKVDLGTRDVLNRSALQLRRLHLSFGRAHRAQSRLGVIAGEQQEHAGYGGQNQNQDGERNCDEREPAARKHS